VPRPAAVATAAGTAQQKAVLSTAAAAAAVVRWLATSAALNPKAVRFFKRA